MSDITKDMGIGEAEVGSDSETIELTDQAETVSPEEPKKFLTKADILQVQDLEHEDVYVEQWGGWVRVRALTGAERDRYEGSFMPDKKGGKPSFRNVRARLVTMALTSPEGKKLFSFNDVEALGKKNASALNQLFEKAQQLSGLRKEDVEELQGNLNGIQSDDGISN